MSDSKQNAPPTIVRTAPTRSPEFKDVYSNHSRINVSPFDFSMVYSKIVEHAPGLNAIEDQVVVRMSPQQFKIFVQTATNMLKSWEDVFGDIKSNVKSADPAKIKDSIVKLKEAVDKQST